MSADQRLAAKYPEWQDLAAEIQVKLTSSSSSIITKRQMARIQPLPNVLATLTSTFTELVAPLKPDYSILWGLIYIVLKVTITFFYSLDSDECKLIVIAFLPLKG